MINFDLKKNPSIRLRTSRGFTLLETLVAISILMVAIVAPITIAQRGLSSAVYSKNQMIAAYLAQDAIEYIKNKRDEVVIKNINNNLDLGWEGLEILNQNGVSCLGGNYCDIDTITGDLRIFSDNITLEKNDSDFYGHSGDVTNFTRSINVKLQSVAGITGTTALDQALITVTVGWGGDNDLTVKTLIYNI